jgi:hypothetical protein
VICSYRWIIFIPYFLLMDIIIYRSTRKELFPLIWRILLFGSGFLVPISFAEFCYFICFFPDYLSMESTSYFSTLVYKFSTETQFDTQWPLHYFRQFANLEGIGFMLVVSLGLIQAIRRRNWLHIYLCGMFLLPLVLYSLTITRVARAVSITAPWMAILAGVAVLTVHREMKIHFRRAIWAGLLLVIIPLPHFAIVDMKILALRSGYREAFQFIAAESNGRHLSTMAPLGAAVFGRREVPLHPPESFEDLRYLCEQGGYRFLLIDWQKYVWYFPSLQTLEKDYQPVRIFDNPYTSFPSILNENYIPGYLEDITDGDATLGVIKIYDLNAIFQIPLRVETIMVNNHVGAKRESVHDSEPAPPLLNSHSLLSSNLGEFHSWG